MKRMYYERPSWFAVSVLAAPWVLVLWLFLCSVELSRPLRFGEVFMSIVAVLSWMAFLCLISLGLWAVTYDIGLENALETKSFLGLYRRTQPIPLLGLKGIVVKELRVGLFGTTRYEVVLHFLSNRELPVGSYSHREEAEREAEELKALCLTSFHPSSPQNPVQ